MNTLALPTTPITPESIPSAGGLPTPSLDQAIQDFESLFVSMLLKQMRQTLGEEGLFPGDSSDSLGGMFDQQMAEHICGHGGLGLAESFRGGFAAASAAYGRGGLGE